MALENATIFLNNPYLEVECILKMAFVPVSAGIVCSWSVAWESLHKVKEHRADFLFFKPPIHMPLS